MLIIIIIFLIAITSLFGMMMFRAWEIKKVEVKNPLPIRKMVPEIYFRRVERIMLYLTKHIIEWIVLMVVKYYFILSTKSKMWVEKNWPRFYNFFNKKTNKDTEPEKNSFFRKAILESKVKIQKIKENVRKEHEKKIADAEKKIENNVVEEKKEEVK
jgi:hypothetical protein